MNDARMRRLVQQYGLHVQCLLCGAQSRHRPEEDGRLRFRTCPCRGLRSLRASAWVKRYPLKVTKVLAEHRAGEAVFAP